MPIAAPIEIVVSNIHSAAGHIRLEVCDQTRFLKDCQFTAAVPARIGSVTVTLPAIPAGRYAIQAAHDENDNKKVDRNFIGIPTEGVGFSRDARVCMGPPRFSDAMFDHGESAQTVRFSIRYHLC